VKDVSGLQDSLSFSRGTPKNRYGSPLAVIERGTPLRSDSRSRGACSAGVDVRRFFRGDGLRRARRRDQGAYGRDAGEHKEASIARRESSRS